MTALLSSPPAPPATANPTKYSWSHHQLDLLSADPLDLSPVLCMIPLYEITGLATCLAALRARQIFVLYNHNADISGESVCEALLTGPSVLEMLVNRQKSVVAAQRDGQEARWFRDPHELEQVVMRNYGATL